MNNFMNANGHLSSIDLNGITANGRISGIDLNSITANGCISGIKLNDSMPTDVCRVSLPLIFSSTKPFSVFGNDWVSDSRSLLDAFEACVKSQANKALEARGIRIGECTFSQNPILSGNFSTTIHQRVITTLEELYASLDYQLVKYEEKFRDHSLRAQFGVELFSVNNAMQRVQYRFTNPEQVRVLMTEIARRIIPRLEKEFEEARLMATVAPEDTNKNILFQNKEDELAYYNAYTSKRSPSPR